MTTKQVCSRCGGSGKYSFNQKDGTVCYGCNGFGFIMVDAEKLAKKIEAQKIKTAKANEKAESHKAIVKAVREKFNMSFGFDIATVLGCDMLNKEVFRMTGKSLDQHVNEKKKVG